MLKKPVPSRTLFLFLTLFLSAIALFFASQGQASQRLLGSQPAGGKYPWAAALVEKSENSYWGQFCGGSLIQKRWVLTAAHCLQGWRAEEIDVVLGRSNLKGRGGERIAVGEIITSGYTIYGASDLALLYLARPSRIRPVALSTGQPLASAQGEILGWGAKREFFPKRLQKATINLSDSDACDQAYSWEYSPVLTYCGRAGQIDSCWRDGGGPLLFDGKLQGVISWKWDCGKRSLPGLYSRIAPFAEWIEYQIANPPSISFKIDPGRDHKRKPQPYIEIFFISISTSESDSMDNQHLIAVGSNYPIRSSQVLLISKKKSSLFCFSDQERCIDGKSWFRQKLGMGKQQAVTEFSSSNVGCADIKMVVRIKNKKKPLWRWSDMSCQNTKLSKGITRVRLK